MEQITHRTTHKEPTYAVGDQVELYYGRGKVWRITAIDACEEQRSSMVVARFALRLYVLSDGHRERTVFERSIVRRAA